MFELFSSPEAHLQFLLTCTETILELVVVVCVFSPRIEKWSELI